MCPPTIPTPSGPPCQAPSFGGDRGPRKGGHGAGAILIVALLGAAILCGRPSSTSGPGSSPFGRGWPWVLPQRVHHSRLC
jgi:hypothetical protein